MPSRLGSRQHQVALPRNLGELMALSLSMPAEDSSPWLSALSFQVVAAGSGHPMGSVGPQHADQLAPLPGTTPSAPSEGDTRRGWGGAGQLTTLQYAYVHVAFELENKGEGWVGRVPHIPRERARISSLLPFLDQLILGCHPWGMIPV